MGESQCVHCGAITPCDFGHTPEQYVKMQALYWQRASEVFEPKRKQSKK